MMPNILLYMMIIFTHTDGQNGMSGKGGTSYRVYKIFALSSDQNDMNGMILQDVPKNLLNISGTKEQNYKNIYFY